MQLHLSYWFYCIHFFLSVISPIGFGGRDIEFFFQHINIYLSQEGFEVLFTGDKNYFKKDNEYIEIMRINGLNYLQEKLLNKNLNYWQTKNKKYYERAFYAKKGN